MVPLLSVSALIFTAGAQEKPSPSAIRSVPVTVDFSKVSALPPQSPSETKTASVSSPPPVISELKLTDARKLTRDLAEGPVQVIVNLYPPQELAGTDFASKASLETLRPKIKKLQQDVLDNVPANDVKVGFRFDNIAGFSAEVSVNGLKALQAHPRVVSIEPVFMLEAHLAQGIPLVHGMTCRSTYNGAGLAIAICDTGVDYNHPRLGGGGFPNAKILGGYDFGDSDANPIPNTQAHGTCCAGIAAGDLGTVGDYIGGVAYNAKLYAMKISSGNTGSATTAAMVAAWDWCVTHKNDNTNFPIMVISTSFGGDQYFSACDSTAPSMTTAANNAVAAGITVLASSGNDGYCDAIAWPSCISSVISVGAVYDANFGNYTPCVSSASCAPKISTPGCTTGWYVNDSTAADKVTAYANVASILTVFAPGNDCSTLDITGSSGYSSGDYFANFGGTSAACPYAAGAVACLQSAAKALTGNYLTPAEVRSRLITYGDNVTDTKVAITKPRVNLESAIESLGTNPVLNFVSAALSVGNGNQSVDPNECNDLKLIIRNNGSSAATNIAATLTTATPGLTVVQSSSTYPNLAAAASDTNATLFRISTSPSFVCGTPVNLTLVLTYGGGTNTSSFSLGSGDTNYVITQSTGATIVPGTTDIGNHGDATITTISLPFACTFYGQTFSSAVVSADGNLQFTGAANNSANACFPVSGFTDSIFAFWDNLRTDGGKGTPQGIYTSTSGVSPNRIFNIEWRASYYHPGGQGNPVNFEVRLYENLSRFDLIYENLNGDGSGATVGAQKSATGPFTQFECNSGGLSSGLQLTFQKTCANGGGGCGPPAANFVGSPTNGPAPLAVSFTNLSSGATSYSWNFGDGKTSSTANPANTYTNAGSYSVTLTAIGPGGTNALTRTNYIVVTNPPPPVVADYAGEPTNGIAPLTVAFTNLSSGASGYSWDFGDGNSSTNDNPANTYSNAGSYSVTLTATGPGGANALTRTNYIVVTNPPPPVVADFAGEPTNGVAPLSVSFTNLSSSATSYTWDFGDGNSSTNDHPANTYTNAGSYSVTLTAIGAGGTNTLTRTNYILVTNPPQLEVSPATLDFGIIATGATVQATFVVSNAGGATLSGTATVSDGAFAIVDAYAGSTSNVAFTVLVSSSTNIVISFTPTTQGAFSNAVLFVSNGGDSTNVVVGEGISAPVILWPALDGVDLTFSFETISGRTYLVQYKDSLDDPVWQTLQTVAGDGTLKTTTNSTSVASQRFFRLSVQ